MEDKIGTIFIIKRPLIYIFLFFLLSCTPSADYSYIKVSEVIDGDTIKLSNGELLRYIGIDTPELSIKKDRKFIRSPAPFAHEAKKFNQSLVGGKFVRIEFDVQKKDKYKRLLGYCFLDGTFVNARLIEEGYAVLYTFPPNVKYTELFVTAQKKARHQKKGMWGAYEVIDHTQAAQFINQIRTVRGKILNTYQSNKCIFLNFGRDYKADFTVVIFNNSFDSFYQKGIDTLRYYRGKLIEVTGRIREYNGPEIIVNTPDEIEVIDEE